MTTIIATRQWTHALRSSLLIFMLALLTACFHDEGSSSSTATLEGTAATGLPFIGTVQVVNARGVLSDMETIAADGSFSVRIKAGPPYLIKAESGDGNRLFSYADGGGTVNITPLTHLAVFMANGNKDISETFGTGESGWKTRALSFDSVEKARKVITENIKQRLTKANLLPYSFDLFYAAFKADGTGFDAVLDGLNVTINLGSGSFQMFDANDLSTPLGFDADIDLSGFGPGNGNSGSGGGAGAGAGAGGGGGGGGNNNAATCNGATGTWCLTLSGTIRTEVFGQATYVNIGPLATVGVTPPGSTSDIATAVNAAYQTSGAALNITETANTNSRKTFTVYFRVTTVANPPVPSTTTDYNLTYDYLRAN